jgi:large subunit ribosomal protein L4
MATSLEVRAADGSAKGSVTLDAAVFGIQPNVPVLHQVITAQLAAARSGTQSTKTRAEVSGGGRKPFKQKGTGRARQGSERAPQFTGGGVAFGPKPRSYRQRTPRKMIQLALRSALSDRAALDKVMVVDSWPWSPPSTKEARAALGALGLEGKVLVVLERSNEDAHKSFRNLPDVQLISASELNAYDILCNDWIVFTRETLPGASVEDDGGGSPVTTTTGPSADAVADESGPAATLSDADEASEASEADEATTSDDGPAETDSADTEPADTEPADTEDGEAGHE